MLFRSTKEGSKRPLDTRNRMCPTTRTTTARPGLALGRRPRSREQMSMLAFKDRCPLGKPGVLRRGVAQRVGDHRAPRARRLVVADRGVLARLPLELSVDLCAQKHCESREEKPRQHQHDYADRAVRLVIATRARHVPREDA